MVRPPLCTSTLCAAALASATTPAARPLALAAASALVPSARRRRDNTGRAPVIAAAVRPFSAFAPPPPTNRPRYSCRSRGGRASTLLLPPYSPLPLRSDGRESRGWSHYLLSSQAENGRTSLLAVRGTRSSSSISSSASEDPSLLLDFTDTSVVSALAESIGLFRSKNIPEPDWSAVHLLSSALNLDWDGGYRELLTLLDDNNTGRGINSAATAMGTRILSSTESTQFASMVRRRLRHEPLQYIIGQWDFGDLTLKVRPPCLCPRPETEELVEHAADDVGRLLREERRRGSGDGSSGGNGGGAVVRILDVGCGTGAIGLALARRFGPGKVDVTAIDVDPVAVELSNDNAADVLGPMGWEGCYRAVLSSAADFTTTKDGKGAAVAAASAGEGALLLAEESREFNFDVVVSNPPYIPRADMDTLTADVVEYESYGALCGGDDGLDVVRDIVDRLPEWAAAGGGCVCCMEVDVSHPALVEGWLPVVGSDQKGKEVEFVEGLKDLCGRDRFVKLRVGPR